MTAAASSRRSLFWASCSAMFLFGIVLAILGALFGLPAMRMRLHADLVQQGDILFVLFLGVFASTILVGPVIDRYGNKIVLSVSGAATAAALAGFAGVQSVSAASLYAFVLGFGGGGLNTAANALIADVYPERRAEMLNLVGTFFGVGAFFIPLLAASLAGRVTIPQLLAVAAALAALCTIAYLLLPFPPAAESSGFSMFASVRAARIPGVVLLSFVLFFESGNESAVGGWMSTYAGSAGLSPSIATWILAAYWAAMMIGRVISARIVERVRKETMVLASGIGSAIGMAILLLDRSVVTLTIAGMILGLAFAAVYPTTLAIAGDRYQRNAGTIFGLLFAVGLLGGMSFPWAVGHISEAWALRAGMALPLVGAAGIIGVILRASRDIRQRGAEATSATR